MMMTENISSQRTATKITKLWGTQARHISLVACQRIKEWKQRAESVKKIDEHHTRSNLSTTQAKYLRRTESNQTVGNVVNFHEKQKGRRSSHHFELQAAEFSCTSTNREWAEMDDWSCSRLPTIFTHCLKLAELPIPCYYSVGNNRLRNNRMRRTESPIWNWQQSQV